MGNMQVSSVAWILAALFWSSGAGAQIANSYRLPPTKQNLEPCRVAALALKPGTVENIRVMWQNGAYRFWYEILERNGEESKVVCDGATGHILWVEPDQPAAMH